MEFDGLSAILIYFELYSLGDHLWYCSLVLLEELFANGGAMLWFRSPNTVRCRDPRRELLTRNTITREVIKGLDSVKSF